MSDSNTTKDRKETFPAKIGRLLADPHPAITDAAARRQARLLAYLSLVYMSASGVGILTAHSMAGMQPVLLALTGLLIVTTVSYVLARTRAYLAGAVLLIAIQSISGIYFMVANTSGTFSGAFTSLVPAILLATVYLSVGWTISLMIFNTTGILSALLLNPGVDTGFVIEAAGSYVTVSLVAIVIIILKNRVENERILQVRTINQELEEARNQLVHHVTERTQELAQRTSELETANKRAERRASQFEAIAQITRAASNVQNLTDALERITQAISTQFGYYHAGIFLVEETGQFAVLTASNSPGGQKMLARGHKLEIGKVGIVGHAVGDGQAHIALDTGRDAVYFNNPDLPNTHSEIALPLKAGNQVIGALDVQSTEPNAFNEDDVETLGILADQVSLAIENTRLFEQTQRALAEAELLNRQYLRQEWERLPRDQKLIGYRYGLTGVSLLESPMQIRGETQVLAKGEWLHTPRKGDQPAQLTVPVQIRGETIGVLNIQSPEVSEWHADQIEIAVAVAERVALSVENARLFEETSRRAERERTVSRITTNIRSSNDPQTMLKTALEELKQALGATDISIRPFTHQQPSGEEKPPQEKPSRKKARAGK